MVWKKCLVTLILIMITTVSLTWVLGQPTKQTLPMTYFSSRCDLACFSQLLHTHSDLEAQWAAAKAVERANDIQLVMLVCGIVGIGGTFLLLRQGQQALRQGQQALTSTREIDEENNRAWIVVKAATWYVDNDSNLTIRLLLSNIGNRHANCKVHFGLSYQFMREELTDFPFADELTQLPSSNIVVPPKTEILSHPVSDEFTPQNIDCITFQGSYKELITSEVRSKITNYPIFLLGKIDYKYGSTTFCYRVHQIKDDHFVDFSIDADPFTHSLNMFT